MVRGITCQYTDYLKKFFEFENKINISGTLELPRNPEIKFENVKFKYPGSENYVYTNLNFTIKSKEKISLVGVNGAGKSTLVKLILRFYDPTEGKILINDIDISEYNINSLRKGFGVLFQDIICYPMSFKENITLSNISEKENSDLFEFSCKMSGANKLHEDWKNSLDTSITRELDDNGVELSGGQKQKLALSRAYFRDSDFIVLDEPSSALDPEAEDFVFSQFMNLCKDKGAILISHRLSNTIMADRIFLLENGEIKEQGTHNDLINLKGRYAYLYELQASKYSTLENGGRAV